ncbi:MULTISPECIES: hypothetical protein [unclassified Cyanobium]|nr:MULTISPECIES: hypothetical protein [unclassified Cyanobium]
MGEVFLEAAPQGFEAHQSLDRQQPLLHAARRRTCWMGVKG